MASDSYVLTLKDQEVLFESIIKITRRVRNQENPSRQFLVGRLSNLQEFWERCRKNHVLLIANPPVAPGNSVHESDYEDASDLQIYDPAKFNETEEIYEDAIDLILSQLPEPPVIQAAPHQEVPGQSRPDSHHRPTAPSVHLPRITIPKFSGEYSEWLAFRDLFTSLVIKNESLSDAERLHYLKVSLADEALIIAQNQPGTANNFQIIWKNLESRYDNCKALVFDYLKKIVELPDITSDFLANLKHMRNVIITVSTALTNLNRPIDEKNDLFVYILINKLDKCSRDQWELVVSDSTDPPSLNEFTKFLDMRIRALEASVTVKKRFDNKSATNSSHPHNNSRPKVFSHQSSSKLSCCLCKGEHNLYSCPQFKAKSANERYDCVRENNRCTNCLGKHYRNACVSKNVCSKCGKPHHSLLHREQGNYNSNNTTSKSNDNDCSSDVSSSQNQSKIEKLVSSHLHETESRRAVLLATARVIVEAPNGRRVQIRALLDQGSEATFISESVVQLLHLSRKNVNVMVSGLGGNSSNKVIHSAQILVKPVKPGTDFLTTQAFILPKITSYVPTEFALSKIPSNLQNLELADPCPCSSDAIDLLIGADLYSQTLKQGVCPGTSGSLIAQSTIFGWILSGPLPNLSSHVLHINVHHALNASVDQSIARFWELEEVPHSIPLTKKEIDCENHFAETHSRDLSGKYTVKLPFDQDPNILGDSLSTALNSFDRLEKRFSRNPLLALNYQEFITNYKAMGHMSLLGTLDECDPRNVFIPHHPVLRDCSQTMKLRVVFNASSPTSTKISLNDCLHVGPKLQNEISTIILNWRQHKYVLCADIANMFRQILISPDDRKYQCIIWRDSPADSLQVYELNTVTYGMASSPYLAIRVLRQLAKDEEANFPIAAPILLNDTYVDDTFLGGKDKVSALTARDQLIALTSSGGFPLRKWFSNEPELLEGLPDVEHGLAMEMPLGDSSGFKVLGIFWDPAADAFIYRFSALPSDNPTKRSLLSAASKLFDPLGWISPVTISAKILLQKLWLRKLDWDDLLPSDLAHEWDDFRIKLSKLSQVSVPRYIALDNNSSNLQIHGFSDASSVAYAAVVYSRVVTASGTILVSLLTAKTKVAPLKTISIPRLELCAASLLTTLLSFVIRSLNLVDVPIYCWTDSSVVLSWLQKPPVTWTVFVANRVSAIQTSLPSALWNHVPSKENPADCASRGLSAENLPSFTLWWRGPPWLSNSSGNWPQRDSNILNTEQEKRMTSHNVTQDKEDWHLKLIKKMSSWARLLRVTAYVLRAINVFKTKVKPKVPMTAIEIREASIFWVRYVQATAFSRETDAIKSNNLLPRDSPLKRLNPFIDDNGIVRLGGRLLQSNLSIYQQPPAILPKHVLSRMILEQFHKNLLHSGIQLTLYMSRTQYWIINGRSQTNAVVNRCVTCVRHKARTETQIMGDLPTARISPSRPFSHTGLDYAGPFLVRSSSGRGSKSHKAWIAVFICLAVKAIHLELVHDLSTATFIAAFRRFTSRRGIPSDLYSDNGTNFRGADRELSQTFRTLLKDPILAAQLASDGTTWHFMPPYAPNFGGLWEAGVKSVKGHLRKLLSNSTPTAEELTTLLCQIESCLNSRPLVPINEDPESCDVLTPGHFLVGSALKIVPTPSYLDVPENRLTRWQFYQRILEHFWRSWSRVYLQTLQQRTKWFSARPNIKVGDIVLIKNEDSPPSKWDLARIIKCISGRDGVVRVVHLKTANSEFVRPISKIVLLPTSIDDKIL
ncbi:uncharacterized protein LOC127284859 [Leptopilina boulardi]|uniref:uncharacterized protein LOC127284859 n=1 Tax=Leptopilina boulardi TaxID=63433 RepID=UPI0021F67F42|nr:uncharacterized protein LOC127284859 [Leptopilina boulardi]